MHQSFVTTAPQPTEKGKLTLGEGKLAVKTLLFAPPFTIKNLPNVKTSSLPLH